MISQHEQSTRLYRRQIADLDATSKELLNEKNSTKGKVSSCRGYNSIDELRIIAFWMDQLFYRKIN